MRTVFLVSFVACFASFANLALANGEAVRTMASITMTLNHFPSESDKQKLADIIKSDDSTESEIVVASAISNIEHQVPAADKAKLKSIIEDKSAPADLHQLASILVTINHRPSESDVEKLEAIIADNG